MGCGCSSGHADTHSGAESTTSTFRTSSDGVMPIRPRRRRGVLDATTLHDGDDSTDGENQALSTGDSRSRALRDKLAELANLEHESRRGLAGDLLVRSLDCQQGCAAAALGMEEGRCRRALLAAEAAARSALLEQDARRSLQAAEVAEWDAALACLCSSLRALQDLPRRRAAPSPLAAAAPPPPHPIQTPPAQPRQPSSLPAASSSRLRFLLSAYISHKQELPDNFETGASAAAAPAPPAERAPEEICVC